MLRMVVVGLVVVFLLYLAGLGEVLFCGFGGRFVGGLVCFLLYLRFLFLLSKVPSRVFKLLNCGIYSLWALDLGENQLMSDNLRQFSGVDAVDNAKKAKSVNQSALKGPEL